MRKISFVMLFVLVMPLIALGQAAEYSHHPPKVLVIGREDVKPGKSAAHEKSEAAWTQAFARAKWPSYFLAMSSFSGPSQVWFCIGYDSFADMEKDTMAQRKSAIVTAAQSKYGPAESEFLEGGRGIVATLNPDISYHADFNLPEMRYFRVRTTRVKYGHDAEYVEARKMLNAAFEKAGVKQSAVSFRVVSGAPAGTYLTFFPSKSAAEWDRQGPTLREALGGEYDKFLSLLDKSVTGYEDNLFEFSNKMSYMSPETIAADKWWAPKPAAAAPAADKTSAAPAKKEPAAK
jgi:hypothetical protein